MKKILDNPYIQIFCSFFKFGLFTIGGGLVMVSYIEQVLVEEKKWLTKEEFLDGLTISQGLPGIVAINMATYVGYRKKGIAGAICATIGVIMPSLIIMIIVAMLMKQFSENRFVSGALMGVKACAVALVTHAVIKLGKPVLTSVYAWIIAIASLLVIALTGVQVVWVVIGGIVISIIYTAIRTNKMKEVD